MNFLEQNLKHNERGAALLTVLVAIMLMTLLLFEFQYNAMVERKLAYNELNQVQAYYLAKSGARVGMLRTLIYMKAKRHPTVTQSQIPLGSYLEKIWSIGLPPFPPDLATIKQLEGTDKADAEKAVQQTKISDGKFSSVITSESSKINLNSLRIPKEEIATTNRIDFNCREEQTKPWLFTGCAIINLIDTFLKESENPMEEYPDLKPSELVVSIMDWVNPGGTSLLGGPKDTFYEKQIPPYKAKRDRFYTLDELRMVKDVDEKIFEKLKPHVTVYSEAAKININTATTRLYRSLYPDFTDDDLKRLMEDRDKMGGFATGAAFVDYVTKTLNRTDFTRLYSDPKNYPFTTNTESFFIESMGKLDRSGSSIQKLIREVMASSSAKGGVTDSSTTAEAQCRQAPGHFWSAFGDCKWKPTNDAECQNLGGTARQAGSGQTYCCELARFNAPGLVPVCISKDEVAAFTKSGGLKILSWSET